MTTTKAAPGADRQLTPSTPARKVAAAASALFGVALFMTVAAVDVPHDATDAELLQWWQQSGNRMSGLVSGLSAIMRRGAVRRGAELLSSLSATARRRTGWRSPGRWEPRSPPSGWSPAPPARRSPPRGRHGRAAAGHRRAPLRDGVQLHAAGAVRHGRPRPEHPRRLRRGAAHRRARPLGRLRRPRAAPWSSSPPSLAQYGGFATPVAIRGRSASRSPSGATAGLTDRFGSSVSELGGEGADQVGRGHRAQPLPALAGPQVQVVGVTGRGRRRAQRPGHVVHLRVAAWRLRVVLQQEPVDQCARRPPGEGAGHRGPGEARVAQRREVRR